MKRSNDVIKYAEWGRQQGLDKETMDFYEMEARVLRVFYYNTMWKYYGNIPFYLENLSIPYTAPQMKADEIYERLIVELGEIIDSDVLPMRWDGTNSGRFSNAAAMMLYAEMSMYQNDEKRMKIAAGYMDKIIKSGKYNLHPDYAALWEESGEWCEESIFEINYNNNLRIYRFSEALLNAAELIVRGCGEGNAQIYLDQVRTRAGLKSIPATLDNIIEERHLEFVGEGKRYFDLVRLVDVPTSSKNAQTELVPDSYGYRTNAWTKRKKYIPLAQGELDADPTLVQNEY